MGNPTTPATDHARWKYREEEPANRLRRSIEQSEEFERRLNSGLPPAPRLLLVTGGAGFADRQRVFAAMTRCAQKAVPLSGIVVSGERWPGAEFHAAAWARNSSYRVDRLDVYSSVGAEDARHLWIRACVALPGLHGIVAFPEPDESLIDRAIRAGIKTWRPYG